MPKRPHLRPFIVAALLAMLSAITSHSGTGNAAEWQAGVAKAVLTPPQPMWMSGYASRTHPAEGKLHDLWAKALVIQDPNGHRLLLISLDLVGIDRPMSQEICRRIQENHGIDRSQVALCTSHTHTGPVVGTNLGAMYFFDDAERQRVVDYTDHAINTVVQAAGDAFADLSAAQLSIGQGTATFAVNRRNNTEADVPALRESGALKGPVDHSVAVMRVTAPTGEIRAIVFGYACHATVLSFYQWSGDWPGFAQIEIEKQHPGAVALFMAGCGADQNPLPRRTVELAEEYGRQTARAVNDALVNQKIMPVTGSLRSAYQEIDLDLGQLPTKAEVETDMQSTNQYIVGRANLLLRQFAEQGSLSRTYPYPVQVWAIGDQAKTILLGGEVVVDYSLRIKSAHPDENLFVAGYSNDVMAYIPSLRVLKEGGYEGATSMIYYGLPTIWSERVEEHIIETVDQLLQNVHR